MVETSEISVQTDDKFKTPLYVRKCAKRYRDKNYDKVKEYFVKYRRQKNRIARRRILSKISRIQ